MFDWIFVTAFRNIVNSLKITFWIIRGIGRLVSGVLNRRQNIPRTEYKDLYK